MEGLQGKNILVIGGSSGIGATVAENLTNAGATVLTTSRKGGPEKTKHVLLDVSSELSGLKNVLPHTLDGLVYCPGTINLKPFARLMDDDFTHDFEINVMGAIRVIRESLKALKNSSRASIVLYSSVAASSGMHFHASVATSKRALEGLAVSLAAEFATFNIRVNVIAPSLTNTPLAASLLSTPERQEASSKRHPLGRFGQPQDIAAVTLFLLSEQSSWITGQILHVDGGMSTIKNV